MKMTPHEIEKALQDIKTIQERDEEEDEREIREQLEHERIEREKVRMF